MKDFGPGPTTQLKGEVLATNRNVPPAVVFTVSFVEMLSVHEEATDCTRAGIEVLVVAPARLPVIWTNSEDCA